MSTRTFARFYSFIAVLLGVLMFVSSATFACGPFTLEAIFVHTVHPGYPMERFAAGRIGVLQPSYARSYLYVAYRYLEDAPLSPDEQKGVTELWKERLNFDWSAGDEDWVKSWLDTRRKVVAQDPAPISVYRSREKPNDYETYLNCQKDSFDTAIATLNERIAKYGADSETVKTWVTAQDQVFSNCAGGNFIPSELPGNADSLARADRNYQIAAANFYATNYDEARGRFEAIASDSTSPWKQSAVYLVARALARKGSLGSAEQKQESLLAAEAQLQKILADKRLSSLHAASLRLLSLVRLRAHPVERLHELAQTLSTKTPNKNLKQDLWDYTVLMDGYFEKDDTEDKPPTVPRDEDVTDWIATFQDSSGAGKGHAFERWQATHSMPWLIAALTFASGKDAQASELIAATRNVKNTSPAFAAARFHAIRLLLESDKNTEARPLLDQTLKNERAHFDESALNLLISERMKLATTLDEFLTDATRVPAALSWNDDGRELPVTSEETSDETKQKIGKPFFDVDAAHVINDSLPLSILKEAAKSNILPAGPRNDLIQATWLRAALLGDTKTADELAPLLAQVVPPMSELLKSYQLSSDPNEKRFSAIYAWLKTPGLEPVVDAGVGRESPLYEQDQYRDNWWCGSAYSPATAEENREVLQFTAVTTAPPPPFLSAQDADKGAKERAALAKFGASPNYIAQQVIQWANAHADDSRVPEALHLAVKTTRYGCTDKDSPRWSKAAFDLLHRKYPNSSWAKKTPYWFKD
jgi:hypothetical protein